MRRLARFGWAAVPVAVAVVAYQNRDALATAGHLVLHARVVWLVPAVAAVAAVYVARANAYHVPVTLLGYSIPRRFLWATALVATSLHQLVPVGGAAGYTVLTWALHRRGVSGGKASLVALLDTLSYAAAVATLVLASLVYLARSGLLKAPGLATAFVPGVGLVAVATVAYYAQRDRRRFIPLVLRWKNRVARLAGTRWPDGPVRAFLEEYYTGKQVIAAHPVAYLRMVGFQSLAVASDAGALYLAFVALGPAPPVEVVFMGLVVSMAGVAVLTAPGGGGGFEVIMSVFFTSHGLPASDAIAAAVLYRVVAFWLPVAVSLAIVLWLRRTRPPRDRPPPGST